MKKYHCKNHKRRIWHEYDDIKGWYCIRCNILGDGK